MMKIKFDALDRVRVPSMVLCNPNGSELNSIDGNIYNCEFTLRFNTMSEMSFTVPSTYNDGSINIWYNLVKYKRLIKVENIGVFQIQEVTQGIEGTKKVKNVTAFSLESDLNYKKVALLSGIYKFYNPLNQKDPNTLIGNLMSMPQMRGWKIGTVSSDLWEKTRSYEVSDQTVYNFLMVTIEEALECIVDFDTFNKTISFISVEEVVKETDIFFSYENLITNLEVSEMGDELVTAMSCYGGGELTIRGVNPLGSVVIYNFDYFIREEGEWLSDTLRNKIIAWQALQDSKQAEFGSLLTQYRKANSELITLNGELTDLNSQYTAIEGLLKIEYEAGGNTAPYAVQLEAKQSEIDTKKSEVNTKQSQVNSIQTSISTIQNLVKMESNFTEAELEELACYTNESTYTNDNFIQTSVMTAVEIQDMQQELYDYSKKVLAKISQPRYSFEMDAANFLFLKEFQPFTNQLELGCQVTVDMENGLFSYPVLLELTFSYDDPTNFSMTFGNRLRLDKNEYRFSELFGDTVNTSTTVSIKEGNWSEFNNNYQDDVSSFIKNELVAAEKNIVNATNQEIKIGAHGLIGQKLLDNGDYSGKKVWLMNNQIVFTKDNFRTIEAMFGELTNGAYGVVGDIIVGNILAGNNLSISNENNTFRVDKNGVFIKDANIIMSTGDSLEESLNKIDDNLANAIESLEEKIQEGERTIWYQPTMPTEAKSGDIWYDTSNNRVAWLARKGGTAKQVGNGLKVGTFKVSESAIVWEPLQDENIIDALDKAQNAQTTADGKIKTYYSATMPTDGSFGDLWFDTDDKNKPYRHNGTTFIVVQDGAIADAQNAANEANNKINNVLGSDGLIDAEKMTGQILGAKNNIYCLDSSRNKALIVNDIGILIANSKLSSGDWDWRTAISADGIIADQIQSGGIISGVTFRSIGTNSNMELSSGEIKFTDANNRSGYYNSNSVSLFKDNNYVTLEAYNSNSIGSGSMLYSTTGNLILGNAAIGSGILISQDGSIYLQPSNGVWVEGDFGVTGEKPAIVPTQHYGVRTLYCEEADKSYFLTNGNAETENCECVIDLDPMFMETIELNSEYPYIIHVTPYSEATVWVEEINDHSFKIRSSKDTKFSYSLRAIRVSFGNKYLEEKVNVLSKKKLKQIQEKAIERMK